MANALNQGLVRCHDCGYLSKINISQCPRCDAVLHPRLPNSLQRSTALLLSAYFLYIPANIFPIMTVTKFGIGVPHTIVGGIIELIHTNMIPIAVLVLIASIIVPLLKLLGISLLLLCIYYRWQVNVRLLTLLYRSIIFVGRWSMLDIFMISILVALVNLGGVTQVLAGAASTAFASVVVLTMFAANQFDPRLLWDIQNND